jgi:Sulfotransferase domain
MTIRIAPSGEQPLRIAMWSGPRNISTAMMRSFSSRADCAVTDEPFYGAYLKSTGEPHAMAEEIIADMDCDWQSVAETMRGPIPGNKSIWYQKHMSHHMEGPINVDDFPDHIHVFLIRDPALMVASYRQKNELVDARQLGFQRLVEYHERVSMRIGRPAPVIDGNALLADPTAQLTALCAAIGISWDAAMLRWQKGAHINDGIWGSHWYNAVAASNGFGPPTLPSTLSASEQHIADQCRASYDALSVYRL